MSICKTYKGCTVTFSINFHFKTIYKIWLFIAHGYVWRGHSQFPRAYTLVLMQFVSNDSVGGAISGACSFSDFRV